MEKAERLWSKAKKAAADEGRSEDYAYITGILKRMLGLASESSESDIDLLLFESGYPHKLIVESVTPSEASSMRGNIEKIVNEIGKMGTDEVNWKGIALHLKLLLHKWLRASTKERGFFSSIFRRIGLLGESTDDRDVVAVLSEAYNVPQNEIRKIYGIYPREKDGFTSSQTEH